MAKYSAFLFLMTFVVASVNCLLQKRIVEQSIPIQVKHPARVAVPIEFDTPDYRGPYDPADPRGEQAAARRQARITGAKTLNYAKSYIPPGIGAYAKAQGIEFAKNEGKRFAINHPVETAELVGIYTKAKGLVDSAHHKIKAMEKDGGQKKHLGLKLRN